MHDPLQLYVADTTALHNFCKGLTQAAGEETQVARIRAFIATTLPWNIQCVLGCDEFPT